MDEHLTTTQVRKTCANGLQVGARLVILGIHDVGTVQGECILRAMATGGVEHTLSDGGSFKGPSIMLA